MACSGSDLSSGLVKILGSLVQTAMRYHDLKKKGGGGREVIHCCSASSLTDAGSQCREQPGAGSRVDRGWQSEVGDIIIRC